MSLEKGEGHCRVTLLHEYEYVICTLLNVFFVFLLVLTEILETKDWRHVNWTRKRGKILLFSN